MRYDTELLGTTPLETGPETGPETGRVGPPVEVATIVADDGRELAARWHRPAPEPRGAVLVAPAMATPGSQYDAFASWLADHGFLTLTFDYRGSHRQDVATESCDLVRWAHDAASALEALTDEADGLPVSWVGHSLGGQVLPFVRDDLVDRIVLVSSGHGYWHYNAPVVRRKEHLLWRWFASGIIRRTGYFPGRRLGILDDVPANVMRQWMRWCLDERYWGVDVPDIRDRFAEITAPVTAVSFEDDELLSDRAMREMEAMFAGSDLRRVRLGPADLGVRRVGHNGFFKPAHRAAWVAHVLPALA